MFGGQLAGYLRGTVDPNHAMPALEQALGHVPAHFSQTDHGNFHGKISFLFLSPFLLNVVSFRVPRN